MAHSGQDVTSSHIGELDDPAGSSVWVIRSAAACWKGFAEPINCIQSDGFLYVEVMLRHVHIGVAHNALDGGKIHTQCLHLRDVSMSAGMRREGWNLRDGFQCLAELITEVRRIAGVVLLPFLPDELLIRLPQSHGTPSQTLWNRNGSVAVPGFGQADHRRSFLHIDGLFNADESRLCRCGAVPEPRAPAFSCRCPASGGC